MRKSTPELRPIYNIPIWHHHHGMKMQLDKRTDLPEGIVVIRGSAAAVYVFPALRLEHFEGEPYWTVRWELQQSLHSKSAGQTAMVTRELLSAFGVADLDPLFPEMSQWLLDRFGGEAAAQGKFIRWGPYLNIPCPGTGHDGDPNVSIQLDEEIREAIRGLVATVPSMTTESTRILEQLSILGTSEEGELGEAAR